MAASNPQVESENSEPPGPPAAKKIKLVDGDTLDNDNLESFQGFKLIKVLNKNVQAKNIAIHGEQIFCCFPCLADCHWYKLKFTCLCLDSGEGFRTTPYINYTCLTVVLILLHKQIELIEFESCKLI